MDGQLNRLLEALDRLDLRDRTLIVLVSDHGEALAEHDERKHGILIYDATIRVALILSSPALFDRPYRVDDRVVGLVDVVPTTLDLLGLPPAAQGDGQSLLTAELDPDRAVYIESYYPREKLGCSELHGLRRHTDKYILAPRPEYYDLRRDPKELRNLYEANPPRLASLKQELAELLQRHNQTGQAFAGATPMTPEEEARLRSLGYIGTSDVGDTRSRPDPKDRIRVINQLMDVDGLVRRGKHAEAIALARKAATQCDGYDYPIHKMADIYEQTNRLPDACRVLRDFAERHPSAGILTHLAKYYYRLEQYDLMEESLRAAETLDPLRGSIPALRGARFFKEGRYAEAVAQFERAIAIDGERLGPKALNNLRVAKSRLARESSPP
jgi:tetratricopeptide (TPR) repeat protein